MIVNRRTAHSGFTLIEILVVLIIVGLLASLAVFSMGGNSQQRELESHVRELYLLMQTASEQAVLNNLEL
ncbi:MAG: prepilin-type N-terminal cleavage/methylation domain-containing protein, partial [Marinobacter sp.]